MAIFHNFKNALLMDNHRLPWVAIYVILIKNRGL